MLHSQIPMVSDQEIASCVDTLLRRQSSDPANAGASISLAAVVQHVESTLGVDLSHKTAFIRDQIHLLLGPPQPQPPPPPPHFIFQPSPHQFLFQSFPQTPGGNVAVSPQFGQFGYVGPPPQQMGAAAGGGGGGVGVVAVAPPQQYGHGPVAPGSKPIGSALGKESAPTGVKRRGGPGGLSKMCGVSPELQVIVGEPAMPRTQIVKQLWAYIRKNNLQDPNNKRKIICNDELRVVFETDCTDMFKMNKLLSKHIIPLNDTNLGPDSKKLKAEDVDSAIGLDAGGKPPVISASEQKPALISASEHPVGITTSEQYVVISDALANFFGTEEKEMLQAEVLKRISDYIKDNQLEDPVDTSIIHCDSRLQQLFGCESLSTLGVPDMLAYHLSMKS